MNEAEEQIMNSSKTEEKKVEALYNKFDGKLRLYLRDGLLRLTCRWMGRMEQPARRD